MAASPIRWTNETVARFWDYVQLFPELYFARQYGRELVAYLSPSLSPEARILDYGAGRGFLTERLLSAGHATAALDFSPATVEALGARFAGHPRFEGAFLPERLDAEGRMFDAATLVEVVEHLDDDHLPAVFDALRRLLKPGGALLITTPNEEDLEASTVYCPCCDHVFHRWQHVRSWSGETLSAFLERQGFRVEKIVRANLAHQDPSARALAKRVLAGVRGWLGSGAKPPHLVILATRR